MAPNSKLLSQNLLKRYYRVDEVAEYFSISVRTVYRLIEEGELGRTKIRGCLRIPITEIQRYENRLKKQMADTSYPS